MIDHHVSTTPRNNERDVAVGGVPNAEVQPWMPAMGMWLGSALSSHHIRLPRHHTRPQVSSGHTIKDDPRG
jgi:hypothetical protein